MRRQNAERSDITKQKTGINTGLLAIHPITNEKIPLFIADYVLTDYGTGAVMAVPAHDTRDHAFATTYNLPIVQVITNANEAINIQKNAYTDSGELINSQQFNGMSSIKAKVHHQLLIKTTKENLNLNTNFVTG